MIRLYEIECDGHLHGGTAPKPWVARIDGPDEKYGLRRDFVKALNDFRDAGASMSGRVYGVVARFPMRAGHLYEVSRLRGRSSKRHVAREFYWLGEDLKLEELTPVEALARMGDHDDDVAPVVHRLPEAEGPASWVAEVTGLGMPTRLGWVVDGARRIYVLRDDRIYEECDNGCRRLVLVRAGRIAQVTEQEALEWLRRAA